MKEIRKLWRNTGRSMEKNWELEQKKSGRQRRKCWQPQRILVLACRCLMRRGCVGWRNMSRTSDSACAQQLKLVDAFPTDYIRRQKHFLQLPESVLLWLLNKLLFGSKSLCNAKAGGSALRELDWRSFFSLVPFAAKLGLCFSKGCRVKGFSLIYLKI